MIKKIDMHSHLGDILYGSKIIDKQDLELKNTYYERMLQERENHFLRDNFYYPGTEFDLETWKRNNPVPLTEKTKNEAIGIEEAFTNRNLSATLTEMQKSMRRNKIDFCAVMPVAPYVTFEDVRAASEKDPHILPFTSIDFSMEFPENKLLQDVKNGARGLKIHPIIQKIRLDDERIYKILETWEQTGLPVLAHLGVAEYYLPDKAWMDEPKNGEIDPFLKLTDKFSNINFIAGHGGNEFWEKLLEVCIDMKNVYIDTSMASTHSIRGFLKEWGAQRILFASDWPWLRQDVATALIEQEIKKESDKENIYYKNACELMRVDL